MTDTTLSLPVTVSIIENGVSVPVTGTAILDVNALAAALASLTPAPPALVVTDLENFPAATVGTAYSVALSSVVSASGGTAPFVYSLSGLPAGVTYTSGTVSGDPTAAGTSSVHIMVLDSSTPQQTASITVPFTVSAAVVTPPSSGGVVINSVGQPSTLWGGTPPANALQGQAGGNWNSGCTSEYGATLADGLPGMLIAESGSWPIWIPHPCPIANQPAENGIAFNTAGFNYLQFDFVPANAGGKYGIIANSVDGKYVGPNATTVDNAIQAQISVNNGTFGPAAPAAGVVSHYKIPLSALGIPDTTADPLWIYKFMIQDTNTSGNFGIRNCEFTT